MLIRERIFGCMHEGAGARKLRCNKTLSWLKLSLFAARLSLEISGIMTQLQHGVCTTAITQCVSE
jgi:hypothetical protein